MFIIRGYYLQNVLNKESTKTIIHYNGNSHDTNKSNIYFVESVYIYKRIYSGESLMFAV